MARGSANISTGRRGYLRYLYGSHFWAPTVESNWLRGMVRDTARAGIPQGGLYDAADLLLHQPGVAQKRGGTTYAGPVMAGVTVAPYRGVALGFLPGLYLEFEDALGSGTVADSSGNSNTGTVHGGVTLDTVAGLVPGGSGFSADFNGTSGYVTVADATTLNPTSSLSLATWMNFHHAQTVGTYNYTLLAKGSLLVQVKVVNTSSGAGVSTVSTVTYSTKDSAGHTITGSLSTSGATGFSFLVLTDDGTTIKLYLNGSQTDSKTRVSLNASATTGFSGISSNTLYVGSKSTIGDFWLGQLDEFGFYKNVTLSAANVTTLWGDRLTVSAATYAQGVAYAEFPAGSQIVAVGDNNELYQITSGSTTPLNGQTLGGGIVDKPKLRIGGTQHLLVFPCSDGTSVPVVYDGSAAPVSLGGSPPAMRYIEVYASRLVGGGNAANPNRLFFSPALDITSTWDTSESWIDTTHAVSGLAALQSSLLIFSAGHLEKIVGTTPPPQSDMQLAPVADVGCTDARSIVVQAGNCLFANQAGVWTTNGGTPVSLTDLGGMGTYWRELLSGYDSSTWKITADIFGNFYFVTVIDASSNVTTLLCYVPLRAWGRLQNFNAMMYAHAVGKQQELYYADAFLPRVVAVSGIFDPSAANKLDADGSPVLPLLETRAIGGDSPELKALGNGHVSLDMRDAASDDPTMSVQFARGVEATSYVTAVESPLTETTDMSKLRFSTGGDSRAITIRLQQSGASSKTEIYSLEIETRGYPYAAEGQ